MVHVNNFLHMKYSRWPVSRLNTIWSISHRKNTSCESVLLLLSIECISIVMITFPFSQHYGGGRFKFTYSWGKDEDFPIFAK